MREIPVIDVSGLVAGEDDARAGRAIDLLPREFAMLEHLLRLAAPRVRGVGGWVCLCVCVARPLITPPPR